MRSEVGRFLTDPDQVTTDADGFPSATRLSGEYYLGDESFRMVHEPWFEKAGRSREYSLSIEVRCLEQPTEHNRNDRDYLGLLVNFVWWPGEQRFEFDNFEPRVI